MSKKTEEVGQVMHKVCAGSARLSDPEMARFYKDYMRVPFYDLSMALARDDLELFEEVLEGLREALEVLDTEGTG